MASRASCHSQWNLAEKRAECRDTGVRVRFSTLSPFLDGSACAAPPQSGRRPESGDGRCRFAGQTLLPSGSPAELAKLAKLAKPTVLAQPTEPAHFFRLVPAEPRFWQASTMRSAMPFSAALP